MLLRTYILLLLWLITRGVMAQTGEQIVLPKPVVTGQASLEQLLAQRRSIRDYQGSAVELADIGQLLWAAQGQA